MSDDSADATGDAVAPLPTGWTRLAPHKWSTPFVLRTGFVVFWICYFTVWLGGRLFRYLPLYLVILLSVLIVGGVCALIVLVYNLRFPQPWANFDTGEVRAGRRTALMSDIESAWLFVAPLKRKARVLTFRLGVPKGPQLIARLRDEKDQIRDPETARLLIEVLRRSNVRMPTTPDDPSGRFARYNFPGHLTLEDAIAVVENPPGPKDPLPVVSPI